MRFIHKVFSRSWVSQCASEQTAPTSLRSINWSSWTTRSQISVTQK